MFKKIATSFQDLKNWEGILEEHKQLQQLLENIPPKKPAFHENRFSRNG